MMNTMTKAQAIDMAIAMANGKATLSKEAIEVLTKERDRLVNSSAVRSAKNAETKNAEMKADVLAVLTCEKGITASAVLGSLKGVNAEKYEGTSNQKVTAVLRSLIAENKVRKDVEKRQSIFFLR